MKTVAVVLVLVAGFTAAVINGVPPIPAFIALMVLTFAALYKIGSADAKINERAGHRIDQRNAARDEYWARGGQGDPPGLDQQLPRLPEVSWNNTVEIVAVLAALAFLVWAIYS